ncbi:glycosyltransferase family 22 protein [Atractiella rhizophila]|nr:glycosyltransferase family 22 protein [Atractiella rhizophila]
MPKPIPRRVYLPLLILRAVFAFAPFSSAYIHPDEYFQSAEISSAHIFNYGENAGQLVRTWEWTDDRPVRSVVPVALTTGSAFALLRIWDEAPSARTLFLAQRLFYFLLSLLLDALFFSLSSSRTQKMLYLLSPLPYTFLLRSFSNTVETVLLAASFLLVKCMGFPCSKRKRNALFFILGAVVALGIWTRVTFVAFYAPIAFRILDVSPGYSPKHVLRLITPAIFSYFLFAATFSVIDTYYFTGTLRPNPFAIIAPFNLLKYNMDEANLALHGLHPRWLHALVNGHILFGVLWTVMLVKMLIFAWGGEGMTRVYHWSVVCGTLLLSYGKHQEPRFLIPLLVPGALWVGDELRSYRGRAKTAYWVVHVLHFAAVLALFGVTHQGGLLPAMFRINDHLRARALGQGHDGSGVSGVRTHVVFWKTFMPPRHLLIPTLPPSSHSNDRSSIRVTDLAGAGQTELFATLCPLSQPQDGQQGQQTLLVAPEYVLAQVDAWPPRIQGEGWKDGMDGLGLRSVHVDMDRIDQMWDWGWGKSGVTILKVECGNR